VLHATDPKMNLDHWQLEVAMNALIARIEPIVRDLEKRGAFTFNPSEKASSDHLHNVLCDWIVGVS